MGILEDLKKIDRLIAEVEPVVIELRGKVPSKKNRYSPRRGGSGKGFYKSSELQTELDRLFLQIPAEARDLDLVHPDIALTFTVPPCGVRSDRDNMLTTILDLLTLSGTIRQDRISTCNGTITIHPSPVSDEYFTEIVLTPKR